MSKTKIRSKFSPREKVAITFDPESSKTQQHFLDGSKITNIIARYKKTGTIEHVSRVRERYGDFSEFEGVAEHFDTVAKASQAFEQLPATVRNRVHNDPVQFYNFIRDPNNFQECVALGIYKKPEAPPPETIQKVQIINPTPEKK